MFVRHQTVPVESKEEKKAVRVPQLVPRSAPAALPPSPQEEFMDVLPPGSSHDNYTPSACLGGSLYAVKPVKLTRSPNGKRVLAPPPIHTTPTISHVFRFRCSQAGSYGIQTGFLSGACGALATSSTTVQNLASSIKLHSIKVYMPATAAGTADTAMVYWNYSTSAGFVKDDSVSESLPDGVTTSGALVFKPPKDALASNWLSTTLSFSNTCFTIALPVGAIIDLHISFTLMNNNAGYSATTVSTATTGRIYYLPLDGVSSNKLVPQGITTTA